MLIASEKSDYPARYASIPNIGACFAVPEYLNNREYTDNGEEDHPCGNPDIIEPVIAPSQCN
jgi:hypothetical protein